MLNSVLLSDTELAEDTRLARWKRQAEHSHANAVIWALAALATVGSWVGWIGFRVAMKYQAQAAMTDWALLLVVAFAVVVGLEQVLIRLQRLHEPAPAAPSLVSDWFLLVVVPAILHVIFDWLWAT
jgi:hypothetical protein